MQPLQQIIKTVRIKTPCYFIKKNTDDILSSKIHRIIVFDIIMGQVGIEYTPKPGRLDTYFEIEEEIEWGETNKEAQALFSELVSPWLKKKYELIDEKELMRLITNRSASNMKNDPVQETMFFDGRLKVQTVKCVNQIKIIIYSEDHNKLFYSDDKIHVMTFSSADQLEKKWAERIEDFADSLKTVDKFYFEGKYEIIQQPDTYKQLVFVQDKEIREQKKEK